MTSRSLIEPTCSESRVDLSYEGTESHREQQAHSAGLSLAPTELTPRIPQLRPRRSRGDDAAAAQRGLVTQLLKRGGPTADVGDLVEEPVAALGFDARREILRELDDTSQILGSQVLARAEHHAAWIKTTIAEQTLDGALHCDALAGPSRTQEEIQRPRLNVVQRARVVEPQRNHSSCLRKSLNRTGAKWRTVLHSTHAK